jgi:hypothetical protein
MPIECLASDTGQILFIIISSLIGSAIIAISFINARMSYIKAFLIIFLITVTIGLIMNSHYAKLLTGDF